MKKVSADDNDKSLKEEVLAGVKRYQDFGASRDVVRIGAGAYYVTSGGAEVLSAVLGSCISVCVRDPRTGIGGMNHFMLPTSERRESSRPNLDLRLGTHSMEVLLNAVLSKNCKRTDLEGKVFGGADLFGYKKPVGTLNGDFALSYLAREGIVVVAADVGGRRPRRVEYSPNTGAARVKLIEDRMVAEVRNAEETYVRQIRSVPPQKPDFF